MKRLPIIAMVTLGTISVASAEPSMDTTGPEQAQPSLFIDGGFLLGGDTIAAAVAGALLEGGVHLRGSLWAHGMVIAGEPANLVQGEGPTYTGRYRAARAGVENRLCSSSGTACFVSGLDLGIRHYNTMDASATGAQAALQVGLDVGGRVRFRPAIEGLVDLGSDHGHAIFDGLALTMSVGYQP